MQRKEFGQVATKQTFPLANRCVLPLPPSLLFTLSLLNTLSFHLRVLHRSASRRCCVVLMKKSRCCLLSHSLLSLIVFIVTVLKIQKGECSGCHGGFLSTKQGEGINRQQNLKHCSLTITLFTFFFYLEAIEIIGRNYWSILICIVLYS